MDRPLTSREVKCFVEWLEIPEGECPPHHYRLLGLPLFESNSAAIQAAVQRRIHRILSVAGPEDRKDSAKLQSYLLKVEAGLLDARMKASYDEELCAKFGLVRSDPSHSNGPPHVAPSEIQPPIVVAAANPSGAWPAACLPVSPVQPASAAPSGPPSRPSIWPWVAGLMMVNTAFLALIVIFILTRTPGLGTTGDVRKAGPSGSDAAVEPIGPAESVTGEASNARSADLPRAIEGGAKARPAKVSETVADLEDAILPPDKTSARPISKKKPPRPKRPTNPFADFPQAVQIPEVPPHGAENHSIEVAALKSKLPDKLNLRLDNSAANFDAAVHFGLVEDEGPPDGAQSWNIVMVPGEQPSNYAEVPRGTTFKAIARIFVDERLRLRFMWHPDAIDVVASAQVANVVLIMSVGEWTHSVALRKPRLVERAKTHLNDEKLVVILDDLGPLPNLQRVEVEFTKIENVDLPISFQPFERKQRQNSGGDTILGDTLINVGPEKELALPIQFVRDRDGVLSFEIRPRFAQPDDQMQTLTDRKLGERIRTVQRNSVEWLDKYASGVNQLPGVEQRIAHWQAMWNAMMQAKNPNAAKAAAELRQAQGERRKLLGKIDAARKQVPNTYESLAHYYRIVHLASALHASQGIEYRLYAKSRDRDIDLVVGNGQIKIPTPDFIEIVNPGVPGTWIRTDGDMAYEFDAGGGLTVRLAAALRQPLQGTWAQDGQKIEARAGGRGETYKLHEDVLMIGPTGKLFKQLSLQ